MSTASEPLAGPAPATPQGPGRRRLGRVGRRFAARLATAVLMVWGVATLTFFLVHALPGNPEQVEYQTLISKGLSPQQAAQQAAGVYGFVSKRPLVDQYGQYFWHLLHFDLGRSISFSGEPVAHVVVSAAPWTIILVLSGVVVSFLIGVIAGAVAAVRRTTRLGDVLSISGSLLHGIPQFVMALLLAYLFTTVVPIFPYGAPYNILDKPGWNGAYILSLVYSAVLPVLAYALSSYGGWMLTMRSSVVSVLGDDFVLAAELRGLRPFTQLRYIARNAMLPLFTIFALSIGFMFGGAIFIEEIFDYPGLGQLLINAVNSRDYPLMSGAFLLITVAVIVVNLLADVLYAFIDPRVRRAG
jgi:peptide/nickel transport system permease protein